VVEPDRAGMTHRRLQHLAKRLERSLLEAGGIEASQTPVLAGGVERIGGRTDAEMARVSAEMDAAAPNYNPDDGHSWWART
jgi:hypothetical protein